MTQKFYQRLNFTFGGCFFEKSTHLIRFEHVTKLENGFIVLKKALLQTFVMNFPNVCDQVFYVRPI